MKKGQALVEFIIIMPIFMFILLGVIDMGKILYSKIMLEGQIGEVITLYESGKSEEEIVSKLDLKQDKIKLDVIEDNDFLDFKLTKNIDILTPGLNLVFGNIYNLEVTRSIDNGT